MQTKRLFQARVWKAAHTCTVHMWKMGHACTVHMWKTTHYLVLSGFIFVSPEICKMLRTEITDELFSVLPGPKMKTQGKYYPVPNE